MFASGNSGGPGFNPGFQTIGNWDSSVYDGYTNSRYVITVGGVDHDGQYANVDGTFTSYPEAGPNVLVVAPTGSNAALNIGDDNGLGSGMWTTDLIGDFGYNAEALPSGFDPDRDFLADPNFTSRFNGTSGATPLVSGAIALMLEANPNLSYRDVQEILVRSARQNAQFEVPASGGSRQRLAGTSLGEHLANEPDQSVSRSGSLELSRSAESIQRRVRSDCQSKSTARPVRHPRFSDTFQQLL